MRFKRLGLGEDLEVLGEFHATGIRPHLLEVIRTAGLEVDTEYFNPSIKL